MEKAWFMIEAKNGSQWETRMTATTRTEAKEELLAEWNRLARFDRRNREGFGAVLAEIDSDDDRLPLWDVNGFEDTIDISDGNDMRWYAVLNDDYTDWDDRSFDLSEAKRMVLEQERPDAYIAIINVADGDPLCVGEILQDGEYWKVRE